MALDVIVPVFGHADLTWNCLVHLRSFAPAQDRLRFVIVDDASQDFGETRALGEWVQREHLGAGAYARLPENSGTHAAWNAGLKLALSDPVLFINNDVNVMPNCLTTMYAEMMKNDLPYVAATQIPASEFKPVGILRWAMSMAKPGTKPGYFNACFLIRRRVFETIGTFDERFRVGFGDIDFLERMRQVGMMPHVATGAFAWHGISVTRRREFGVEGDADRELADRVLFEEKWKDSPDVLARHPRESREAMIQGREVCWAA